MKKDTRAVLIALAGVAAIIIVFAVAAAYYTNNQTCTMGVSGTAANVTFKGAQAPTLETSPEVC